MEPHDFDRIVAGKIKESEIARADKDQEGMNRVWSAVESHLGYRNAFPWIKVAAMILIMSSLYLFFRNVELNSRIRTLSHQLADADSLGKRIQESLSDDHNKPALILHDTIRLVRWVNDRREKNTVEVVKVVTDTVIIYKQPEFAATLPDSAVKIQASPLSPDNVASNAPKPIRTEYILSGTGSGFREKPKSRRSFYINLGFGSSGEQEKPEAGIRTRL
jgi:hypothetical protein